MKDYKGLDNSYTSYNQDLGGMVFYQPAMSNNSYMKITAAASSSNISAVQNSAIVVKNLLLHLYTKSVMCYMPGAYSLSDVNTFKLHETLPYGKYIFKLPSSASGYDSLGFPSMWYRSAQINATGGCSGGSLQKVNSDETRTLLAVAISNSSQYGLGVRGLDAKAIALVKIMSSL